MLKLFYFLIILCLFSSCCAILTPFKPEVIVKFSEEKMNQLAKDSLINREFKSDDDTYIIKDVNINLIEDTDRADIYLVVDCSSNSYPDFILKMKFSTTLLYLPGDTCKIGIKNSEIDLVDCIPKKTLFNVDYLPDFICKLFVKIYFTDVEKKIRKPIDNFCCGYYSLKKIICKEKVANIYFKKN